MVESIHVYFLYPDGLGTDDRLAIFEAILGIKDFDWAEDADDLHEWWETAIDPFTSGRFRSLFTRVDLDPATDGLPDVPKLLLSFEQKTFKSHVSSEEEVEQRLTDAVELIKTVYNRSKAAGYSPLYVIGGDATQSEHLFTGDSRLQTTPEGVRAREIEDIYWLQIFPPEMVENIDRGGSTVLSAPAHRIEELNDGSVLLVAYRSPLMHDDHYDKLRDWFGLDNS